MTVLRRVDKLTIFEGRAGRLPVKHLFVERVFALCVCVGWWVDRLNLCLSVSVCVFAKNHLVLSLIQMTSISKID